MREISIIIIILISLRLIPYVLFACMCKSGIMLFLAVVSSVTFQTKRHMHIQVIQRLHYAAIVHSVNIFQFYNVICSFR